METTARQPLVLVDDPPSRTPGELANAFHTLTSDRDTLPVSRGEFRAFQRAEWEKARREFLGRNERAAQAVALSNRVDAMEKRIERLVDLTTTLITPTQDNARKPDA